jgi:Ketopantoate reductase PanE/ApbA C terminal
MINGIIDELLELAKIYSCEFPDDFRESIIKNMCAPPAEGSQTTSVMYQDHVSARPMEIETFLGSPLKMAEKVELTLPRLQIIYALLSDRNQKNLKGESPPSPPIGQGLPPRGSSMPGGPMGPQNGMKNGRIPVRGPSLNGPRPGMRRGPYVNGRMNGSVTGFPTNGGPQRESAEGADLAEFSHVMLYDNNPDAVSPDGANGAYIDPSGGSGSPPSVAELALRERELALRHKELEMREREQAMYMRRPPPMRRPQQRPPPAGPYDGEDEGDYFDPMGGPAGPGGSGGPIMEDVDMLSLTSRHRKMPSGSFNQAGMHGRNRSNVFAGKNRSTNRVMNEMPSPRDQILNNPTMMSLSSNRYGTVDRGMMEVESRHGSLTNERMADLSRAHGGGVYPPPRRTSASPGNALHGPGPRPSPPIGYPNRQPPGPNGLMHPSGSAPVNMRQPLPRQPQGHGNAVAPQQVEQHVGVSNNSISPAQNYPPAQVSGSNQQKLLSPQAYAISHPQVV